jgi:hypothetical protein
MTLLEVVVALTITGVALAAGAAVLGFLTDQHARANTVSLASTVSVRTALRDWLSASELGTRGDIRFAGQRESRTLGGRSSSSIDFVTRAPTPVAGGGDARTHVRIAIVDEGGVRRLVAELSAWPAGEIIVLPIADSVATFSVRYRSSIFGPPVWMDNWVSASVLPAAAELRIASVAGVGSAGHAPIAVQIGERR